MVNLLLVVPQKGMVGALRKPGSNLMDLGLLPWLPSLKLFKAVPHMTTNGLIPQRAES